MRRQWWVFAPAISLAAMLCGPSSVEAKGFFLITHGDTVSHVADVPAPFKAELRKAPKGGDPTGTEPAVGFYYSYFGVFWLDFWTWGGKHCLYQGKTSWDVPPKVIAQMLGKSEDQLSKPWFYTFPPGLLVLAGIVGLVVLVGMFSKSPERKVKELLEDPRYQKAIQIMAEEGKKLEAAEAAGQSEAEAKVAALVPAEVPAPDGDKPFAAALSYLINEGIAAKEAEQNLNLILTTLAAAPPASE